MGLDSNVSCISFHFALQYMHIVTICIETMTIINNQKLTESLRFSTTEQEERFKREKSPGILFRKLFFLKKSHKLFIKVFAFDELLLVFDVKNQYFYFVVDIPHNPNYIVSIAVKYTVSKDDLIYMYKCYRTNSSGTKEKTRNPNISLLQ